MFQYVQHMNMPLAFDVLSIHDVTEENDER